MWTRVLLLSCLTIVALSHMVTANDQPPNFVVIFTDDQGYGDLSCFDADHVETPHIDRLAAEGARLTSFYVPASVCTPSRAGLMTGCYPIRNDMATGSNFIVLLASDAKGLHPDEITIAEVLKDAGYATGIFGKWHLGDQPDFLPTRQGFDEFFGLPYSHDIHPYHPRQDHFRFPGLPLLDGERVVEMDPDADYLTKRLTDRAVRFIESNKDRPFFLYLPHPIPHVPLHVSPPFMEGVDPELTARLERAEAQGGIDYAIRRELFPQAISEIDWSVGEIVAALKEHGLEQNTLVVFTSDNGPAVGSAGPLRGRKGSTFEGGMREATVAWWPGKIPPATVSDELLTSMDLLPTFAKLAGADIPTDRVIDGRDIWPVLSGQPGAKSPHDTFFYYRANQLHAVRSGPWKLHLQAKQMARIKGDKSPSLFNLGDDIAESTDVSKEHPDVVARLKGYIEQFQADIATNSRPAGMVRNPKPLEKAN